MAPFDNKSIFILYVLLYSSMPNETEISRRRLLQATGGAAATIAIAGCSGEAPEEGGDGGDGSDGSDGSDGDDGSDGGDENANQLNLINSSVSTIDPIESTDTASASVIRQLYEGLVTYPDGVPEVENVLLDSVDISDDLLTYTFTIKEATFHNGASLTANDFKYSWRRLAEAPQSQRSNFLLGSGFLNVSAETSEENGVGPASVVPDSEAIEVIDDRTFSVTLNAPAPAALDILTYDSFGALPEGYVGDVEGYDGEVDQATFATESAAGTGPFEFDMWEPGTEVRVTRYDDYHGETASLDSVHWQILEDDDAIWTYVNERNADIFPVPTPFYEQSNIDAEADDRGRQAGTYGPLENGDEVNYLGVSELSTFYVGFNAAQTPRSVRRAIAYITNHEELINEVFEGRGQEAFSFLPPGVWPEGPDGYQEFADAFPYGKNETDRDSAQQILEEDGYTPDDPFELTLTTYESEAFEQFGRLTRDKLSGLGIELTLETSPFNTLISRGEEGDLQFYSLGWIWSWSDPAYGLFGFEPENTNTDLIPTDADGYYLDWQAADSENVQKAQDAWERFENNPDPDAEDIRTEAFVDIEEARRDDMIMLPLYHGLTERFWYDYVDVAPTGALGPHYQKYNQTSLDN